MRFAIKANVQGLQNVRPPLMTSKIYRTEVGKGECGEEGGSLINPLTPNDLQRRRAVSPLKIKIPRKNKHEKPTNTPIIHSIYLLCMVAPTCFGITLPSSGSFPSAF
jgi:hypothetical protein